MGDIFAMQARRDHFIAALGRFGKGLAKTRELDELLEQAERNLWQPERLGQYIAGRLPADAGVGLVVLTLRRVVREPEPATPSSHQLAAVAAGRSRDLFRQPLPPCGECDGSRARWLDVTPAGYLGQPRVIHCPRCWTAPPGYVRTPPIRGSAIATE